MNSFHFTERLQWSKGKAGSDDQNTIMNLLTGCISVNAAPADLDIKGIDFVAVLRRGAEVFIDVKRREKGVSKFWKDEPELTLEQWSVCPTEHSNGAPGWTLDESKQTDYILYVFDREDCATAYLIPFQLLRMAFVKHNKVWRTHFKIGHCDTEGRYKTESVFVPASCVIEAISEEMILENID